MTTSREEIAKALRSSTYSYFKANGDTKITLTRELTLANQVCHIESLIGRLIRSEEILFSIQIDKSTNRKSLQSSILGKQFLIRLRSDISDINQHYPIHTFNPFFELFIKNTDPQLNIPKSSIHTLADKELEVFVDSLNRSVDSIRTEAKSQKFKKTMGDFHRLSNKNYRELQKYIDALFIHYSRLLILRIDFGYLKMHGWPNGIENPVRYAEVKEHRNKLIRAIKDKLLPASMVGFAWKLEYGLEKSYHHHVMLFLDGSKVREDVTIARIIGDYWNNTITAGKGLYYNCNAYKSGYKSCGIGMVNHHETALREGLKSAALYMTKTDYYIKILVPNNGRAFGKGNMPKLKIAKRGKPRILGNDQHHAMQNAILPV